MKTLNTLWQYLLFPILLHAFLNHKRKFKHLIFAGFIATAPVSVQAATGDGCSTAENVTIPTTISSVQLSYYWSSGWWYSGRYYYYKFTAPLNGTVHIYTTGANTNTNGRLYNSNCSSILDSDSSSSYDIDITYTITSGSVYKILLYNYQWNNYGNFTLHIDFVPDGTPPTISNTPIGNQTGLVGTPFSFDIDATEPDGDTITYSATGLPDGLSIDSTTGVISGTPTVANTFTVQVDACDKDGCDSETFDIVINPIADAANDSYATPLNTTLNVGAPGLLANDAGPGLTVTTYTQPSAGTLTVNPDGSFSYIPPAGFSNAVSFTYNIVDTYGNSSTATVTITVGLAVSATDNVYKVSPGSSVSGNMMTDDTGFGTDEGNSILVTQVTSPSKGTLTWSADGSFTYTAYSSQVGIDTVTYTITDSGGQTSSASLTFNILNFSLSNPRDFTKVWINGEEDTNIYGDLTVIGNQSLCWKNGTSTCQQPSSTASNNNYYQENINLDSSAATAGYKNSTSANLTLGADDEVIDAWLYWIGRIDTSVNGESSKRDIADRIYLKTPTTNGQYVELYSQPDKFAWMVGTDGVFDYGGAVNVKQYVKEGGTYWVADLQATQMYNQGSGWALAVIIKDNTNGTVRTIKNISLYDGFQGVYSGSSAYPDTVTQTISGFKTPREGAVDSNLVFFSGESDRSLDDRMSLTNKSGQEIFIKDSLNDTNNVQNGTISRNGQNVTDRNPNYENTLGTDIDVIDTSSIIENNQTSTDITLYSYSDRIFLSMFGFATELYQPNVCYDYVLKRNEYLLPSDNRQYDIQTIAKDDEISFTVAIWDISGDIDPTKVSVGLHLKPTDGNITAMINPDKGFYTYPNANTLIETDYASSSSSLRPVITIGKGRTVDVGGTISPDETYYTKFYFKANDNESAKGSFDVDVNVTLNYGSGDFWQLLGVDRCPQNPTYSPTWYRFNVEKPFTESTVPANPTKHYSLPTRVAGKDFDYSVAAYTTDSNGEYTVAAAADGVTVDVEMINIDAFDDNSSYFKCSNAEPDIIVMPGKFNYFTNGVKRITVNDTTDLTGTYAIRSATFRMWLLTDENGTIITAPSFHAKSDDTYFAQVYRDVYQSVDISNRCGTACTSPYNYQSPRYPTYDPQATGCYACLRDYFARPYCARDNFAIRPKAIRVTIQDKGEDANETTATTIVSNTDATIQTRLAAGYPYEANLTAVNFDGTTRTHQYYSDSTIFTAVDDISPIPTKSGTDAASSALLQFNDLSTCTDTNSKTLKFLFGDGVAFQTFTHDNAGKYRFEIWDMNWTKVDNASINPYKTLFETACQGSTAPECNDCIIGNTTDEVTTDGYEKTGCLTGSYLTYIDGTTQKENFTPLNVSFTPYYYDLSSITFHTRPDDGISWLYMNDLSESLTMKVSLEGNVTAMSKDGTALSNFTNSCAAEDVSLWLDRTMVPTAESNLTDSNGSRVLFQQVLKDTGGTSLMDTSSSYDMNATLAGSNFTNTVDLNGSASIELYYNFKKPYASTINPIDVNFTTLYAASQTAVNAQQTTTYLPDGNLSINADRWFYFAKVKESDGTDGTQEYGATVNTTIRVMAYCDTLFVPCSTLPGFATTPDETLGTVGWYRMKDHLSSNGDGQIISLTTTQAGVTISPSSNITFDSNGTTGTISITYPVTSTRPVSPVFSITPDPWLKYDANPANNGIPNFIINFLTQGLRWKGKGETGHVIETEPTTQSSGRLNW